MEEKRLETEEEFNEKKKDFLNSKNPEKFWRGVSEGYIDYEDEFYCIRPEIDSVSLYGKDILEETLYRKDMLEEAFREYKKGKSRDIGKGWQNIKKYQVFKRSEKTIKDKEELFTRKRITTHFIKNLDRLKDREKYLRISKETAREIRDKVLKYLMVRRTRGEVEKYFKDDIEKQGLNFPDVSKPKPIVYELNKKEDEAFIESIILSAQEIEYARYKPLLYYKGDISQPEQVSQTNMGKLMKILLIKRLESSFYAFKKSIDRFINSYERVLEEFEDGYVYLSKDYSNKIYEFLENDNDEAVQKLIDEDKADKYKAKHFKKKFKKDLEKDINILKNIKKMWDDIERDPKIDKFIERIESSSILRKNKFIVFTESKETAEYLSGELKKLYSVLLFTGGASSKDREEVINNFDAKAKHPKDKYQVLVSTEVLSEGVNLHRSNIVINYDIPWNPTRLMQRVGRVNRVDTEYDKIYTYNFFPTVQANTQIKLKEAAEAKIHAFITMLGADARLLTEGEPLGSHELFNKLISKKTLTGEGDVSDSELKYLNVIRNIREKNPDLFSKIKKLPKKARTARTYKVDENKLLTFFKKGKLKKFYFADDNESEEIDFVSAANIMEADEKIKRKIIGKDYYKLLKKNKREFKLSTIEDRPRTKLKGGRDSATQIAKILRAVKDYRKFTEEQESYIQHVTRQLEEGGLPKQTTKVVNKELKVITKKEIKPLKILSVLKKNIPEKLLDSHFAETSANIKGPREVILSEYLVK
ncbi:MAG: helicase-related protein [Elusimicrobiota bacterium]